MVSKNILNDGNITLEWVAHDCFKIRDNSSGKIIYTDPYLVRQYNGELEHADVIVITHSHYDHFDKDSIKMLADSTTRIFIPYDIDKGFNTGIITRVKPYDTVDLGFLHIEAVPAYNIDKPFHPKSKNWLGYILTINNERIYHAGDTDVIPEMKNLGKIDIALLPVSGTYVMNPAEAAKACAIIKPKIAIPMHYGSGIGTNEDAERFKVLAECNVVIL